ncbi:MAG: FAD-dependent oxidoreductase [Candidatus Levybacteria bacterium]|nr:FAD-dependent oxidoreductase [Candidatus Levybacteria bacterium]
MKFLDNKEFDVVIIGGGFYGCMLALFLRAHFDKVLIIEKEEDLLTKASYNNQARVHNGYHYPRSFITALRSHVNFAQFSANFKEAIEDNFTMAYAIASNNSKVTSSQFLKFCNQVGSPIKPAPEKIKRLFDQRLIEEVFAVEEVVYNARILRELLKDKLQKASVKISYNTEVTKISKQKDGNISIVTKNNNYITGKHVFNCTYSQINTVLNNSNLPFLPFKHEFTEMPLIRMPKELKNFGVTIMDGPFFSIMPFPDKKLHTLHHVRYTPRFAWSDLDNKRRGKKRIELSSFKKDSHFAFMMKDAQRYIPSLKGLKHLGSIWETKTLLIENEDNDRRPILYRKDYGIKNFHIVMGGKIDNIYDAINEIKRQNPDFN